MVKKVQVSLDEPCCLQQNHGTLGVRQFKINIMNSIERVGILT
jgi:hypothetical protein